MGLEINVAGVWKSPTPSINVAGVWKTPDNVNINVAGTWKEVWSNGPTVTLSPINGSTNSRPDNYCYAGQFFGTDGYSEEYNSSGSASLASFQWLTAGTNSQVWVMWTRTGGTLSDWDSLGGGNNNVRLQMSTNRPYRIVDTVSSTIGGAETITGYFRMYDAASGGNLLATSATVTYSARRWHDACPTCCFPGDTLVRMASGLEVPINTIEVGDMVMQFDPKLDRDVPVEVSEIMVRFNRPMVAIQFEDGSVIRASTDHPFHIKGIGPASVHPEVEYKSIGVPSKLEVGMVVQGRTRPHTITAIRRIEYPGPVYTLNNSLFYADGKLVY